MPVYLKEDEQMDEPQSFAHVLTCNILFGLSLSFLLAMALTPGDDWQSFYTFWSGILGGN